jgi:hypothetical protein
VSRALIRHQRWTVGPDLEPDREPDAYAAECAVCLARSPQETVPEAARDWIFEHAGRNPSHHTYRGISMHPLRAWMPDACA